jgi:hypothetical protein
MEQAVGSEQRHNRRGGPISNADNSNLIDRTYLHYCGQIANERRSVNRRRIARRAFCRYPKPNMNLLVSGSLFRRASPQNKD